MNHVYGGGCNYEILHMDRILFYECGVKLQSRVSFWILHCNLLHMWPPHVSVSRTFLHYFHLMSLHPASQTTQLCSYIEHYIVFFSSNHSPRFFFVFFLFLVCPSGTHFSLPSHMSSLCNCTHARGCECKSGFRLQSANWDENK